MARPALPFVKMRGFTNDFIVVDARKNDIFNRVTEPHCARALADRRKGIGADQVIVLCEGNGESDVFMRIINIDGTEVTACGNATRCIASRILHETKKEKVVIQTKAGLLRCWFDDEAKTLVTVDLGPPCLEWQKIPMARDVASSDLASAIAADSTPVPSNVACAVSVGNPHVIFFVSDLEAADLLGLGRRLELHPLFPEKVNVTFAVVGPPDGPPDIRVRTWERGAGFTGACGTGACATMVAAVSLNLLPASWGSKCRVSMEGGPLWIDYKGGSTNVLLTGAFTTCFQGEVPPEAWLDVSD